METLSQATAGEMAPTVMEGDGDEEGGRRDGKTWRREGAGERICTGECGVRGGIEMGEGGNMD